MPSSSPADASLEAARSGLSTASSQGSRGHDMSSHDGAMDHLLKPSIAVKPHPPNLHQPPRVMLPLMLLPRQHLPLASMDMLPCENGLPPARFYESHIKILDLESRLGAAASLLVARDESKGIAYALERQASGLYVVCRLGAWVHLPLLARKATALVRQRLWPAKSDVPAARAPMKPEIYKPPRNKRAAIEAIQSLVRKRARSQSTADDSHPGETAQDQQSCHSIVKIEAQTEPGSPVLPNAKATEAARQVVQSPDPLVASDIFHHIRTQYFDALYKSLGSLAYFAKGPLSRARSAFHLDLESNLKMSDLIAFLESLILSTSHIDKKYRETVPHVVSDTHGFFESPDVTGHKKCRPKKMKRGKDVLYPGEHDRIRAWWINNKPPSTSQQASSSAAQIKAQASLLRTRETQLQMIVILEILALESLQAVAEAGESCLPLLPGAQESQEQQLSTSPLAPVKKRNRHNLAVLVDVHADRLTIWQSTTPEALASLGDSSAPQHGDSTDLTQQKSTLEPLKDFCVDVIVPFFSARLPGLCDAINRKLGGPLIRSPPKSKKPQLASNRADKKPGSATQRPLQPSCRKTLRRALSTEQQQRRSLSRGPSNIIALMRSAVTTSVPASKRETSEAGVQKTLFKQETAQLSKYKPQSLSGNSSNALIDDSRSKKRALVEAELKDAISALRKPDRGVVGKAMAEAEERRVITSLSAKKAKKPRSALAPIQVQATPSNNRFRNHFGTGQHGNAQLALSSSGLIGPSSLPRLDPGCGPQGCFEEAFMSSTPPSADLVGATPARPSASRALFLRRDGDIIAIPPSSPITDGRDIMTPDKPAALTSIKETCEMQKPRQSWYMGQKRIAATPLKGGAAGLKTDDNSNLTGYFHESDVSIYKQLGWDDAFDEL
ncbi:hypothetical protein CDD81_2654 [Ophiocordyceps australis]|uniref:DNA replication regulator Sld3 C-terminal domain-containing protein n=1 Tax=Ophiocordyceps australis TaxID=1399860 RepID=A0A2C5XEI6_9HYPO|nr:hypothetical protein CDD81_2654 [Ophiocordyceps australis]